MFVMHKDILLLLARMGLKDRESRLYITCLKFKDGLFTYELVKETGITRSTVDLTVDRLLKRGLLTKVKVGRRYRYFAQAPETVLFRQKQLVEDLEQIVPMLSLLSGQKKDMDVLYFEGLNGYRQIWDDVLLQTKFATGEKKDILTFLSGMQAYKLFPNAQKAFIDKRIRNKTWFRAIQSDEAAHMKENSNDPKAYRECKFVQDSLFKFRMDIVIYADTVSFYSAVKPLGGVVIRNEKMAASMRTLFHLVWNLLPSICPKGAPVSKDKGHVPSKR